MQNSKPRKTQNPKPKTQNLNYQRLVHFLCFGGDRGPAEFFDSSLASGFTELLAQMLVPHQFINFLLEISGKFVRINRFERALLHLLQWYEIIVPTSDYHLF